jgi:DNA-binding SARP family transcriptional activator
LAGDRNTTVRAAAETARARLANRPREPLLITSFGTLGVSRAGCPISDPALRRGKPRAVLGALLCARGPVHRDRLLEWLWPDLQPDRAKASLHTTLSALRRALEGGRDVPGERVIVTDGESYRVDLRPEDEWDAARFLQLANEASRAGAVEARISRLLAAESVRQASFLPEWPYEEWARAARAEVDLAYEGVLEGLGVAFLEVGQPESAAARYLQLLELDPERERWHRALIRAYAAAEERGLALRQFHVCRQLLRERLGVEPSDETQALFRSLL